MQSGKSVDAYIQKHQRWHRELTLLREMLLDTALEETVKWGGPVYTIDGKNVVGLGAFKEFVSVWFFQGALLKDAHHRLIAAQDATKALRQWRFTSYEEIAGQTERIRAYIEEAIANQEQGKAIKPDRQKPLDIPPELAALLAENSVLKEKFEALSKSKQREYAEHIAEAKRPETKQKRLEKIVPMILQGVGLHDKYRK